MPPGEQNEGMHDWNNEPTTLWQMGLFSCLLFFNFFFFFLFFFWSAVFFCWGTAGFRPRGDGDHHRKRGGLTIGLKSGLTQSKSWNSCPLSCPKMNSALRSGGVRLVGARVKIGSKFSPERGFLCTCGVVSSINSSFAPSRCFLFRFELEAIRSLKLF